jgi:Na+-transporting NADH:ubiquinone oxidoreductase subunit NqrA
LEELGLVGRETTLGAYLDQLEHEGHVADCRTVRAGATWKGRKPEGLVNKMMGENEGNVTILPNKETKSWKETCKCMGCFGEGMSKGMFFFFK